MKPSPGSLSPFQSSSSQNEEKDDNNLEFYVEGGEKMTEKKFDIDSSKTESNAYDANTSTEPDAKSELAMEKSGEGTYSTTANTTVDAPEKGETTEPTKEVNKADSCCSDCKGPECKGCCEKCMGMSKAESASCCDNSCGNCKGPGCGCCKDCKKAIEKSSDEDESKTEDSEKTEIKKSVWGGAFSPFIKR